MPKRMITLQSPRLSLALSLPPSLSLSQSLSLSFTHVTIPCSAQQQRHFNKIISCNESLRGTNFQRALIQRVLPLTAESCMHVQRHFPSLLIFPTHRSTVKNPSGEKKLFLTTEVLNTYSSDCPTEQMNGSSTQKKRDL